jgi:hypothetical protein
MTALRALPLLACLAVTSACLTRGVPAPAPVDTTRHAADAQPWTAQEISDACRHRPGARMRLYGCRPDASIPRQRDPLYVIDGVVLPTDTSGSGHLMREATIRTLRAEDVEEITVIKPDSAVTRFGPAARFGAIIIRTKRVAPPPTSGPDRAPGV